jgi:hypothetical protein
VAVGCPAAVAVALAGVLRLAAPDPAVQLLDLELIERLKHMAQQAFPPGWSGLRRRWLSRPGLFPPRAKTMGGCGRPFRTKLCLSLRHPGSIEGRAGCTDAACRARGGQVRKDYAAPLRRCRAKCRRQRYLLSNPALVVC